MILTQEQEMIRDMAARFSEEELAAARRLQSPWGKVLARIGG